MKIQIFLISMLITLAFGASPVFLSDGGTKICTLNNVGTLPSTSASVKYPVYQKVCRQVIPTALGDQIEDEEKKEKDEKSETKSQVNQLRRAIIERI